MRWVIPPSAEFFSVKYSIYLSRSTSLEDRKQPALAVVEWSENSAAIGASLNGDWTHLLVVTSNAHGENLNDVPSLKVVDLSEGPPTSLPSTLQFQDEDPEGGRIRGAVSWTLPS